MSAEYSVEEVRALSDGIRRIAGGALSDYDGVKADEQALNKAADMLLGLAERIKADEGAVPVAEVIAGYNLNLLGPDYGCSLAVGTKLYTHPLAQAVQVSINEALNVLEDAAVNGLQLYGDYALRFRALTDRLAPTAEPVAMGTHNVMWGKCKHGVDEDDMCHECAKTAEPVARPSPDAADGGLVGNSDIERIANLHGVRSFSVDGKTGMSHVGWRFTASQLCAAIEAALAAQGQGEQAVAWMCETVNGFKVFCPNEPSFPGHVGKVSPLYTHPATPASPAGVPDGLTYPAEGQVINYTHEIGYVDGWNDCRDAYFAAQREASQINQAMLAAAPSAQESQPNG